MITFVIFSTAHGGRGELKAFALIQTFYKNIFLFELHLGFKNLNESSILLVVSGAFSHICLPSSGDGVVLFTWRWFSCDHVTEE